VAALNTFVSDFIRARWAKRQAALAATGNYVNQDVLDRVMAAVDPATWSEATVLDLRDQIKSFILAGHETSASMLTWTVFQVSQCPHVRERLLAEGRRVFPAVVGAATPTQNQYEVVPLPSREQLNELAYTVCTLKESLRRYSLVPVVTRQAVADDMLGEQPVPAGTKIFINIKAVHMDPANWAEPEAFRPERFERDFDPYTFLPFVNGPRNCLGQHLALLEARIVLSLLTQRFELTPVLGARAGEEDAYIVPVVPRHDMLMLVK
jgi:cytochrome P450